MDGKPFYGTKRSITKENLGTDVDTEVRGYIEQLLVFKMGEEVNNKDNVKEVMRCNTDW